nr:hypothetical protein CFP56_19675 [Quercus suber]
MMLHVCALICTEAFRISASLTLSSRAFLPALLQTRLAEFTKDRRRRKAAECGVHVGEVGPMRLSDRDGDDAVTCYRGSDNGLLALLRSYWTCWRRGVGKMAEQSGRSPWHKGGTLEI